MVRRLGNTNTRQDKRGVAKVVDDFGQKLLKSGYSLQQTRKITLNGIRGLERKIKNARVENKRLYRTSKNSLAERTKKKTIEKTTWYKGKRKKPNQKPLTSSGERRSSENHSQGEKVI